MKKARVEGVSSRDVLRFWGKRKGILPWFSPGSVAGDDAGSQKEGWGASPPGLVLPLWRPLNRQSRNIKQA